MANIIRKFQTTLSDVLIILKDGINNWKSVWITLVSVMVCLSMFMVIILTPLTFIIPVFLSLIPDMDWNGILANDPVAINALITTSLNNPILLSNIIIIAFVISIIIVLFIGVIQKFISTESSIETTFKDFIKSDVIPLSIVGGLMLFLVGIPVIVVALIFNFLIPGSQDPLFTAMSTFRTIILVVLFLLLSCPLFLASASVIVDKKGLSSSIEGWRLYKNNFSTSIITFIMAMSPAVVLGGLLAISGFISSEFAGTVVVSDGIFDGLMSDPVTTLLFFLNSYAALIGTIAGGFTVIPMTITIMYALHMRIHQLQA